MDFQPSVIEIYEISKSYGGVQALQNVSLRIQGGEVHALCGENGAGKSTLNRILSGAILPDSGMILLDGKELTLGSIPKAEESGIAIVHQESVAFLQLSCTENHQLMREPTEAKGLWLNRREMRRRAVSSLAEIGENFNPDSSMEEQSLARRQMVAIARAVSQNCRLLILDEPTASLSNRESETLFKVIRKMRDDGVAILYVSHRLDEIFELADQVTVLRDGHWVITKPVQETSPQELIQSMVGRTVEFQQRQSLTPGDDRLRVEGLSKIGVFQDISFSIKAGEVVGLAGLVGAGRSEIARAIFGIDRYDLGTITVNGRRLRPGVNEAIQSGIAFSPEDRQHEGLHLPLSIQDNLMMAVQPRQAQVISNSQERQKSKSLVERFAIKIGNLNDPVSSLSGGNQQKVLLGKWLTEIPNVLILDEPTRGVDVGAKDQIHRLINELAAQGVAILVISSELTELLSLCDRYVVMCQGRVAGELTCAEASQEAILELAFPKEAKLPDQTNFTSNGSKHKKLLPRLNQAEQSSSSRHNREISVGVFLILTFIIATVVNSRFLSVSNVRDMLINISPALIVGTMMTFAIMAREIDISVGSLMGLSAAVLGIAASPDRMHLPPIVAVILCLIVGALGGLFNGILVSFVNIPSIIVTLGTLTLFRGLTQLLLGGKWITNIPHSIRLFGTGSLMGMPYIVIVATVVILMGLWMRSRSRFGFRILAIGSNPRAAQLFGIRANRAKIQIFLLTGVASAVAALMSATKLQVIENSFGSGFELVVIAAVIVGGTSIQGGRGSIIGTVLAVAMLGIISTVLIFLRLGESASYWNQAIQGGFILLAILGDHFYRLKRQKV